MWNILHHINNYRWHHARKRLTNKSYDAVVRDSGGSTTTSGAGEMQENLDATVKFSPVEGNLTVSGSVHKSSTKSRIKALITEQVKRRGRHRRSSSDPIRKQLGRSASIHHLELSDVDPPAKIALDGEIVGNQDNAQSSIAGSSDPFLEKFSDETAKMLGLNYQKQTEDDKQWKQPVGDHNLLQGKLTSQELKLFLDALDSLNMREELFMKILQDPNCSFANHLHVRWRSSLRFGLTKSVSFPVASSSGRIDTKTNFIPEEEDNETYAKDFNKHLLTSRGAFMEDAIPENFHPSSAHALKKRHENKVVMKRFKNLRKKLKHAIWESKNEKQRIVMDAVLHKVPYGRRVSKEAKEDTHMHNRPVIDESSKYSQGSDQFDSGVGKKVLQDINNISSFNESLDRYSRLLETSFGREEKHHISEKPRLRTRTPSPVGTSSTATLARILSLPDLRSYSYFPSDDSPGASSLNALLDNSAGNVSIVSNQPGEERSLVQDSETKILPDTVSESGNQEYLSDVIETFDDIGNLGTTKKSSSHDVNFEHSLSSSQVGKLNPVFEHNSHYPEDEIGPDHPMSITKGLILNQLFPTREDSLAIQLHGPSSYFSIVHENTVDTNNVESIVEEFYSKLLYTQEDTKNKSEFNYVRDVLELSGFSGNEILGKWHSIKQPVDPSVFEEVEGCLIDQPVCSGNEEGGVCNHLLLFDLINEVLLDIYERSFSYWQKPLTCQSHIHRMPFGYHVLEEVWADVSWYLSWKPEVFLTLDDAVRRDLAKVDGWMNLQFDAEFVGLEMEDLIFDDLLEELIFD
ncbi:unnamed protein product [Fraxinus pennsylvanica]|uniref:DUF4378 domain-containing protein n=1 Tax=Fraxinus pennsylvanica TaxID=56036 RepID=A0AAD2E6G7_9LAMI|nr:unnamed protein product [Fraxinus pennsylvanica]